MRQLPYVWYKHVTCQTSSCFPARPRAARGSVCGAHSHLVRGHGAQTLEHGGDVVFTGVRHAYSCGKPWALESLHTLPKQQRTSACGDVTRTARADWRNTRGRCIDTNSSASHNRETTHWHVAILMFQITFVQTKYQHMGEWNNNMFYRHICALIHVYLIKCNCFNFILNKLLKKNHFRF